MDTARSLVKITKFNQVVANNNGSIQVNTWGCCVPGRLALLWWKGGTDSHIKPELLAPRYGLRGAG